MREIIVICITAAVVLGSAVAGCTYTVTENNRRYYETMQRCMESGGSFVPTRGSDSSAACISR